MVKFIISTALVATFGTAYLGNMSDMAQKTLDSGKKLFGGHANKIDRLSHAEEDIPSRETDGTRAAFGGITVQPASTQMVTTTPMYGQQTAGYFVQSHAAQPLPQNSQGVLYGSEAVDCEDDTRNGIQDATE